MRANTSAILASPEYSLINAPAGKKWAKLAFPSPRAAQSFALQHAGTPNETSWASSGENWMGLDKQPLRDFQASGVAHYPRDCVSKAVATLPAKRNRFAGPRASITGAVWDVPAVLSGVPLCARTRVRDKLPPQNIKIVFTVSAGISVETMAPILARIAKALWDYTIRGGAVSLTLYNIGKIQSSQGAMGLIVETRINAADVASLSLALSPAFFRTVTGPLMTATSEDTRDSISIPRKAENPIPGALFIGGVMEEALLAAAEVEKALGL